MINLLLAPYGYPDSSEDESYPPQRKSKVPIPAPPPPPPAEYFASREREKKQMPPSSQTIFGTSKFKFVFSSCRRFF